MVKIVTFILEVPRQAPPLNAFGCKNPLAVLYYKGYDKMFCYV